MSEPSIEDEIASLGRRADQACTIHAFLRDRYAWRADALDYSLMAVSTYLLGLSFVEPVVGISLSFGADTKIVVAILSIATFFLSVVQFKSDWKLLTQAHSDAFSESAAVKSECGTILNGTRVASLAELQRIRGRYDLIADTTTPIPESQFVKGKARHLRKIYLSRYLDSHPGALPALIFAKLVLRDNFGINLLAPSDDSSASKQSRQALS